MATTLQEGGPGQFDVLLGDEVVASRGGSILARLLGGGWPDEGQVVAELARRLGRSPS